MPGNYRRKNTSENERKNDFVILEIVVGSIRYKWASNFIELSGNISSVCESFTHTFQPNSYQEYKLLSVPQIDEIIWPSWTI